MVRRTIPRAAAGTTAVLALAVGLLIGQGGPASAESTGSTASTASAGSSPLTVSGTSLEGATVTPDALVTFDAPKTAAVSWQVDGVSKGRDTQAPFELKLATSPGTHKLTASVVTASGQKTTQQVSFRTATSASSKPANPSGTAAPSSGSTTAPSTGSSSKATTSPSSKATTSPTSSPATKPTSNPTSGGTTPSPSAPAPAAGGDVRRVSGAAQLQAALKSARPGQVIQLADGNYSGRFVASGSGTSAKPIVLRGGRGAVLNGGSASTGMALQLQGANYWRLEGFSVRGAQKGVVLDQSNHNVLSKLDVGNVGMEGVHFRTSSSDNRLEGSDVHHTGRVNAGFGEGVYVGSAISNWGKYGNKGGMDRSDRNVITGNRIHAITSENIDIKEGTTGGQITDNVLEGDGMTGAHHGDSWLDVKGNGYLVANNTGTGTKLDGFQTHVQLKGWGRDNTFRGNKLTLNAKGIGINIYKADASSGNVVACDNKVTGAAGGMTNLKCR